MRKKWGFSIGTLFTLLVVYFIFLYSRDKGWRLLELLSKWYLIIVGGFVALSIGIVLLVLIISFFILLFAMIKLHFAKKGKRQKDIGYIDADFKLKE